MVSRPALVSGCCGFSRLGFLCGFVMTTPQPERYGAVARFRVLVVLCLRTHCSLDNSGAPAPSARQLCRRRPVAPSRDPGSPLARSHTLVPAPFGRHLRPRSLSSVPTCAPQFAAVQRNRSRPLASETGNLVFALAFSLALILPFSCFVVSAVAFRI